MDVVRHQAICLDLRAGSVRRLGQQVAVEAIVIVAEESRLATISALGHVMWNAGNHKASNASHPIG
jgi:hypothetical protein